ncbi:MAG: hypothetical protein HY854_15365 [Burkholderiales bacterium]|nr:hypothetical protein [Burkholderiales bacterium]
MQRIRWFAFALIAALVLAQALGAMHRIAHFGHAPSHAQEAAGSGHWVAALFDAHGEKECPLLDGVAHDLITAATTTSADLPKARLLAHSEGEALARFAALFNARGPPVSFFA